MAVASDGALAAGCEWLHVDFEDHLRSFYFGSCGFSPTNAGLIALRHASPDEKTIILRHPEKTYLVTSALRILPAYADIPPAGRPA